MSPMARGRLGSGTLIMDFQRLILFVVFSLSLLMLWEAWQKDQMPPRPAQTPSANSSAVPAVPKAPIATSAPNAEATLARGQRIKIDTDLYHAEIDTAGGDLRYLALRQHKDVAHANAPYVLFKDNGPGTYYPQSGLVGAHLPNHKSLYRTAASSYALSNGASQLDVRLEWDDPSGVHVAKIFTFKPRSYVIGLTYQVTNRSGQRLEPYEYLQLVRDDSSVAGESAFIHTYKGPAIYTNAGKFEKVSFSDIEKGKENYVKRADNGWVAMLQHYFLAAWLPPAHMVREYYTKQLGPHLFAVGTILPLGAVDSGKTQALGAALYAGPQEQEKLSRLAPGLDLTVDYGWLTVIATPLFWTLSWIHKAVHNWGVAIILLTVLIKLAFYPLSAKSYRSMAQMRVLAPKLQKLKEQYGDDRQKIHQAMMELYKTEKINPLSGCLPILVQIPVFIALYWVLLSSVEMRHAPFFGWIHDLSAPDPFYVLPVIMAITMIVQTRLNPAPTDPIQAKVMMIMPFAFGIFFFFFPAGLVLYWVVNNLLSIAQQWQITRSIERAKAAKGNGRR